MFVTTFVVLLLAVIELDSLGDYYLVTPPILAS